MALLTKELHWRVKTVQGQVVDSAGVKDLKIFVVSRDVVPPASIDQFPVYKGWNVYPSVTAGKAGGLNDSCGCS